MRAVLFEPSGMNFVTIGPSFDLLNATERDEFFSAIPGMVLDAVLQTLLDKLLLQRLDTVIRFGDDFHCTRCCFERFTECSLCQFAYSMVR